MSIGVRSASDVSRLQRRWGLTTLWRTGLGTVFRYLSPAPIVRRGVPMALLTFTIYPDLARLWHKLWTRVWPTDWPIIVVDSSGELDPKHVPSAKVYRFANKYHGWKADRFIHRWIESDYVWLTDDDKFVVDPAAISFVRSAIGEGVGAVSFAPRIKGWRYTIDGNSYVPMGSYCVVLNAVLIRKAKWPLAASPQPCLHKPDAKTGKPGKYDTLDWANEQMLRSGYRVTVLEDTEWCSGFDGTSSARILATVLPPETLREALLRPRFRSDTYPRWWAAMAYGLFAVANVASLYSKAFGEKPQLAPPMSAHEVRSCVERATGIPEGTRRLALTQMFKYDGVVNRLSALIRAGG